MCQILLSWIRVHYRWPVFKVCQILRMRFLIFWWLLMIDSPLFCVHQSTLYSLWCLDMICRWDGRYLSLLLSMEWQVFRGWSEFQPVADSCDRGMRNRYLSFLWFGHLCPANRHVLWFGLCSSQFTNVLYRFLYHFSAVWAGTTIRVPFKRSSLKIVSSFRVDISVECWMVFSFLRATFPLYIQSTLESLEVASLYKFNLS